MCNAIQTASLGNAVPLLLPMTCCRYPGLQSTSSYRQLTTIGCCHQYTIRGYALAKGLGPGTRMCSDLFEAGGQQFRLEIYPAGDSSGLLGNCTHIHTAAPAASVSFIVSVQPLAPHAGFVLCRIDSCLLCCSTRLTNESCAHWGIMRLQVFLLMLLIMFLSSSLHLEE